MRKNNFDAGKTSSCICLSELAEISSQCHRVTAINEDSSSISNEVALSMTLMPTRFDDLIGLQNVILAR